MATTAGRWMTQARAIWAGVAECASATSRRTAIRAAARSRFSGRNSGLAARTRFLGRLPRSHPDSRGVGIHGLDHEPFPRIALAHGDRDRTVAMTHRRRQLILQPPSDLGDYPDHVTAPVTTWLRGRLRHRFLTSPGGRTQNRRKSQAPEPATPHEDCMIGLLAVLLCSRHRWARTTNEGYH